MRLIRLPIFASFAGVIAVLALVWYLGPLIPIPGFSLRGSRNRLIVIVVVIVLFAIYQLIKWLLKRRKDKKLASELAASQKDPTAVQTDEEMAILRKTFEQAVKEIKNARLDSRDGSHLYSLPWYLIIGPPGSGKTTALVNSGLKFPLAKRLGQHKIQGIGGTRNCDWFFTDQAVLIDTAGRYTTQDSHQEVDRAAWFGFLDLLKKYRRRRPINGVIVAISLADLAQLSESERNAHAVAIRERIEELYERLSIRFPVYVLFTKADLIAGYREFFDDLGQLQRQQVWGMSFPLDDLDEDTQPSFEKFEDEFLLLEKRLNERLLERLQSERDSRRRDLIYSFPQQFVTLKAPALGFLEHLFRPSKFEQRSLLRGVYFTSGTQEGNPIDRMLGALARIFGVGHQSLPSFSSQGKSYFLTRLFRSVIFPEAGIASSNIKLERRRAWIRNAVYVGVAGLSVASGLWWLTSYAENRTLVDDVNVQLVSLNRSVTVHNTEAATAATDYASVVAALPLLNQARTIRGAHGEPEKPPWYRRLGLYQGDKLAASAQDAYRRMLEGALTPRLLAQIEQQLSIYREPDGVLYETLETYLLLHDDSPPATAADEDYDPAEAAKTNPAVANIKRWFKRAWRDDLEIQDEQRRQLAVHLDALLAHWPLWLPRSLDQTLITKVRQRFPERPTAAELYQRIKVDLAPQLGEFNLVRAAGEDARKIFTRESDSPMTSGVSGLYTKSGRDTFKLNARERVVELTKADPVLAREPLATTQVAKLNRDVVKLHQADSCPLWESLLDDIAMLPSNGPKDTLKKLEILSQPQSPMRRLLQAVADNTTGLQDCLKRANAMVSGDQPTPLAALVDRLGELATKLRPLVEAENRNVKMEPEPEAELWQQLDRLPDGLPAPIDRWMEDLATPIAITLSPGSRPTLNQDWDRDVRTFCEAKLGYRYPLASSAADNVSLDDFGKFFGPDGVLDEFLLGNLVFRMAVNTDSTPWRWDTGISKRGIPARTLERMRFATLLKAAYFSKGGQRPSVDFKLVLTKLSNVNTVVLRIGDREITLDAADFRDLRDFTWPSPSGSGDASIRFYPGAAELVEGGEWGWFRLLDHAVVGRTSDSRFQVSFSVGDQQADFELRSAQPINPFNTKATSFRCPRIL